MTDKIQVETCDHARLWLQLAYRWVFKFDKSSESDCQKLFSIKDFVGDACKTLSSRIRGAVSSSSFDYFHKNSSDLIRNAIFKKDENGEIIDFVMPSNNLHITQVDIQSIDPVDEETKRSLQKSINLAFDIQTQSQEAAAKHQKLRLEQEAKGQLNRQIIKDNIQAENARKELLEKLAENNSIKSSGLAIANSRANAESKEIISKSQVEQKKFEVRAKEIKEETDLELLKLKYEADLEFKKQMKEIDIERQKKLAEVEASKQTMVINAVGKDTLVQMARAGPET